MEARTNRMAPGLTGRLSPEVERVVRANVASGRLAGVATPDAAAIRRDARDRDRDTALRPAFLRDCEKIVHMPAYNLSLIHI